MSADLDLIARAISGEKQAIDELLSAYQQFVFSVAYKHGPKHEAESVAQAALVSAFRSLPTLKSKESFKAWLRAITIRRCRDAWRSHYRKREVELDGSMMNTLADPKSSSLSSEKESALLVEKLLERLSPNDRLITTLYYLEDRSVKEVSTLLGITQVNVKVRTFRLRKKLEQLLEELKSEEIVT